MDASLGATSLDNLEVPVKTVLETSSAKVKCHTPGKLPMDEKK